MTIRKKYTPEIPFNAFEMQAWTDNLTVCGIDEVGRGCLAGPLVAAAVILPINTCQPLLRDSKIMTVRQRDEAFDWIQEHCSYAIGIVHNRLVDEKNVHGATKIAMKKALLHLLACQTINLPSTILIDAVQLPLANTAYTHIPMHYFPYGERLSSSIAAASIVAKVTRDRLMHTFDALFPHYNLKQHKGYATKGHSSSIEQHSHSIIHRSTFLKQFTIGTNHDPKAQQRLC